MIFDFMITKKCNAHCPICFTESTSEPIDEIAVADIITFLRNMKEVDNSLSFHITGGEPFCHSNIVQVLTAIDNEKINYQFVTNGTLIGDYNFFKNLKYLSKIVFSIYGDAEIHDKFVGIKDAFENITRSIQEFTNMGICVQINVTCFKSNIEHIIKLLQSPFIKTISCIKLYPVLSIGRACKNDIICEESDYKKLISAINDLSQSPKELLVFTYEEDGSDCQEEDTLFVNEFGDIYPCLRLQSSRNNCIGTIFDSIEELKYLRDNARKLRCKGFNLCKKHLRRL